MSYERRVDKTWWWNKEVQEWIEGKKLAKKWGTEKTEESRQTYRGMRCKVKVQATRANQRATMTCQ